MPTPNWLTEDEMSLWRGFLTASAGVLAAIEADLKHDAGIGLDDYEVLVALSAEPEHRMRMSELSDRLLHSRSRLSQRIDRMVERGLVVRERCPGDGRGMFAVLTDHGYTLLERAAPDHVASVRRHLIDRIPAASVRPVGDVLEGVVAGLAQRRAQGSADEPQPR